METCVGSGKGQGATWAVRDRCELQGRPGYPPLNAPRKDTSGAHRRLLPAPSPSPGENRFPLRTPRAATGDARASTPSEAWPGSRAPCPLRPPAPGARV